jgi:hypothetical protein
MKQFNVFSESELKTLRYAIGNINHDVHVIEQNLHNLEYVQENITLINGYIEKTFAVHAKLRMSITEKQ